METSGTINSTNVQSIPDLFVKKKLPTIRIKRENNVNFKANNSVDHYGRIRTGIDVIN